MRQIEDFLAAHARQSPEQTALVCGDSRLTYRQLYDRVQQQARQLAEEGAGPYVPLRAACSVDFLVSYLGVHRAGLVAVPLEADLPTEQWQQLQHRLQQAPAPPAGTADVLFTTGTTGRQKGVVVGHEALVADAENLAAAQGYAPGLTFLLHGALSHIGSLSKVYPVLLTGGTLHLLPGGLRDMAAFFAAAENAPGRVATFMVPATLRMLLTFAAGRLEAAAARFDFIETGAAPLPEADMQRLCRLLPHTRLYNTYASTETGIIATHNYAGGQCRAGLLGAPMRHSSLRISAEGTVECGGKTLMTGYFCDPEATARVLQGGWLHTADLGRLDPQGRLLLQGRRDCVINAGGYKVNPEEVEEAALATGLVTDSLCVPAPHPVLGTVLRLLAVVPGGALDKKQLALALRQRLPAYKVPAQYEAVAEIPRTFNGKKDRKKGAEMQR